MAHNLTTLYAAETGSDLVIFANSVTGGVLFGGLTIALFVIMLYVLKRFDFDGALVASSFSCFIISGIATYGGLLNIMYPLTFLAILAFSGLFLWLSNR